MFMKPKLLYSIIPIVFDLTFQRWNVWIVLLTLMSGTAAATRALAAEPSTVEHLLVAHRFAGEIVQFGANGREGIFAKDGLKAPGAVIAGPDGNIYVSDYERSAVVRYAPDGVALGTFASEGLDAPLGLLFDPSGNLLVVNYGSKNVVKIAPNGTRSAFITKGLDGPVSIVRTANGEFLVSNSVGNNIRRYSAIGADLGILTTNVNVPIGIALNSAGVIHVANAFSNTIGRFAPDGSSLAHFGAAHLDAPTGLAFASNGDLYVANAVGGNVRRYSSTGADLGIVGSGLNFPYLLAFARTTPMLDAVHADVGIDHEDGVWNLHLHDESHDIEYAPEGAVIQVSEAARALVPQDARFGFLGAAGGDLWLLPQVQNKKIIYLGMAADGVADGVMRDNKVRFTLASFSGPGDFILYGVDGFGSPAVYMNTRDGISPTSDFRELLAGGHEDRNWAFTAPGVYRIGLQASGILASNGQTVQSPVATYTFHVLTGKRPAPAPRFTYQTFDLPGAKETLLADIDNQGRLVGRYKDANGLSHGFFQDGTNGLTFNVTGNTATFATGFDSAGRIVGFYRDAVKPDVQHGFLRQTNGTFVTIDSPANTTTTYLWRINEAGQINGYHFENEPFFIRSFRRAGDGSFTTNIVFPGSPLGTVTRGMNEAGVLAGWKWTMDFALQGVTVSGTNFTSVFTVPDWANTLPGDINNRGEIAGTVINADFSDRRGFFRTSDGRTSVFAPPGATEVEVFGLNDGGVIVGEFVDQAGKRHGFIASPAVGLEKGHTDIGIAFDDGAWDLHIHAESTDTEYEPNQAVLRFGTTSEQPISDSPLFQFLGDPGRSTWILPQVENENLLFLGLAAEEIGDGVFVNNTLRVELASVEGPGNFFVWTLDPLGKPQLHFNSADGILSSQDFYLLKTGGHQDMNWAFSAPGTYRVGYRVSGTLVAGNQFTQSDVAYYTFEVPEAKLPQPPQPDNTAYLITDLGTLGGPLFHFSLDVNNAGQVVGASNVRDEPFSSHAFLYEGNGPIKGLGTLGGNGSQANSINEAGVIVGWAETTQGGQIMRLRPGQPMETLGPAGFGDGATGINEAGMIVGTLETAAGDIRGFVISTNGQTHDLGTFGGAHTFAKGINNSGVIVGWSRNAEDRSRAFRHAGLGPLNPATDDIGTLGGRTAQATAINDRGRIVGRSTTANGSFRAFLWEQGKGMTDLGTIGGGNIWAFGINNHDTVVGWGTLDPEDTFANYTQGWVWTPESGMNNLNSLVPRGAQHEVNAAYGVNDQGWIVGGSYLIGTSTERPVLLKPATRLSRGHTDLGALLEDGKLELEVHSEELNEEFEPGAALLQLPALTQTTVPTNTAFAFLGAAGTPVWVLPQVQHPKLLFLGLAAEEIEKGVLVDDKIQFTLKKVEGPGHFFLYAVDGFRNPVVNWNSRDGLTASDVKTIAAGGHEDMNWAFTSPGYYRVTIEASGTLIAGNKALKSGEVTYHFEVIGIEPKLALRRTDAATIALTASTEDGIVYQLQSAAIVSGPWSDVGQPFIGTGRDKQFSVPSAAGAAFFRIVTRVNN